MVIADVVAKLQRCGVPAAHEDVLTSAVAAGALLGGSLPSGARVLACAGPGVIEALTEAGLTVVREPPAAAVVVGFHRDFDYDELERAVACGARRGAIRRHEPRRHVPEQRRADPGRGVDRRRDRDCVVGDAGGRGEAGAAHRRARCTSVSAPAA